MADTRSMCQGGQFDGNKLATPRDESLCTGGGGVVIPGQQQTGGGCAGDSVQNFSSTQRQSLNLNTLRTASSIFGVTEEVTLLRKLSAVAVQAIETIMRSEPEKAERFFEAGRRIESMAANLLNSEFIDVLYTEEDHKTFVKLGNELAEQNKDSRFADLFEAAMQVAERFRDTKATEVREKLGGLPEFKTLPIEKTELHLTSPSSNLGVFTDTVSPVWRNHFQTIEEVHSTLDTTIFLEIQHYVRAEKAISMKAQTLGSLASSPQGDITDIEGGFVQKFAECDIFYSDENGAHEIHGDIRRKYWQINGPTRLGLPTTDETACPDGRGRFNHFVKSSIYWTPSTGPFYLRNACRFRWASEGWELGPLGYPVQDEESFSAAYPGGGPTMYWSHFQNGIVFGRGPEAQEALAANASKQQVLDAFRTMIDRKMPSFDLEVGPFSYTVRGGLYGVDFLGVDDWNYGFNGAIPRTLRVRINGFISVPIASDPTFSVEMGLQFSTRWPIGSFFYPSSKKLVATLIYTKINVEGIVSGYIANILRQAIWSAFSPGPADPEITDNSMAIATIPTGANQKPGSENLDFLDVMLMADGSLNVYVNPLPALGGALRKYVAQNFLNAALENL